MESAPNQGQSLLLDRLERVRGRIERALERAHRSSGAARLLAVVKLVPDETVAELLALGVTDVAENRVQHLAGRDAGLRARARWHLIGPLQTNKVKKAVALAAEFHALDRAELVPLLDREAAALGRLLPTWIQVNVAREPQKHGCTPETAGALARAAAAAPHLAVRGLMTIAPLDADPEAARPHFRRLAQLSRELRGDSLLPPSADGLSMGMSHDFEVAIEEGATVVRVGSAIFESAAP